MKRLLLMGVAPALLTSPALAQVGQLYGAYNAATVSLNSGQFYPLQVDQNANLKVDCVLGCSTSSSVGAGSVSQGPPASLSNAWPIYLTQGSASVGPANGLAVTDTNDGTAASGLSLPPGASGEIGWLSAIEKALSGTIIVQQSGNVLTTDTADGSSPPSGTANGGSGLLGWLGTIASELTSLATQLGGTLVVAPASNAIFSVTDTNDGTASTTAQMSNAGVGLLGWLSTAVVKLSNTLNVAQVSAGSTVDTSVSIGTASTTAVPAASGVRYRATLTNTSAVSGNTVWCRADGGTAAAGIGIQVPASGGGYEWDFPLTGAKPVPAITCIATSATATVAVEYVQ